MTKIALHLLTLSIIIPGCSPDCESQPEQQGNLEWHEQSHITQLINREIPPSEMQWRTGESLAADGTINLKYYTTPEMVDGLPARIQELKVGMSQFQVESHLAQGSGYAWGFNTISRGLLPMSEGENPEELTFLYGLTEINKEQTASRHRYDLLIHWKINDPKGGDPRLTYLGAKRIPRSR